MAHTHTIGTTRLICGYAASQISTTPWDLPTRSTRPLVTSRSAKLEYRASVAQWKAEMVARQPKNAKLVSNPRLQDYVQDRLSRIIRRPNGTIVAGPAVPEWKGETSPTARTGCGRR